MGISRSFNIGVTGLNAMGQGIGVISDNISNAATLGFKASRAEFQDVLATSLKGIDGGDQFGAGTKLAHIQMMMNQGDIARTDRVTDLAISGDGFFQIDAPFGKGYSRDGSFHFNKVGELVNSDGYQVMGFKADGDGKLTSLVEPIKLGNTTIPASASTEAKITMNIDSREKVKQFNPEEPEKSSNFAHALTVYDNVGTSRNVTLYYNKVGNNNWEYHAMVDGKDAAGADGDKPVEMATGTLVFNAKGQLQEEIEGNNAFNFNKGAAPGQKVKFDFGKSVTEGGDGLEATTQYGSNSAVSRHSQDGASAATLTSMSFNDDGILTAVYNNGESRNIAQIAVSKFENNEGLFKLGKNLYKESRTSGQAALGKPRDDGRGEILSKSIELSNVDVANEFVNLMTMQRNFQANAKTLATADQMLQEVLNIKR